MTVFCPATMCPLFAAEGSPWTGTKNSACPEKPAYIEGKIETDHSGCGFFNEKTNNCDGQIAAHYQVDEVIKNGRTFQIGPKQSSRKDLTPRDYDCPRAKDCSWQKYAGDQLCPPRYALKNGVDPRACAW